MSRDEAIRRARAWLKHRFGYAAPSQELCESLAEVILKAANE